jgi:hypothetical protein
MMIVWSLTGGDCHPISLPIFTKLYLAHRTEASGLAKAVSYTISFKQRPGTKNRNSASEHKNETWRPYFAYHRLISRSL